MIRQRAAMAVAIAASALVVWWLPTGSTAGASSGTATAPVAGRSAHVASMPVAGDAEAEFIDDINQLRQSKGLNALIVDDELTSQARIWASTMNDAGQIFHSQNLASGISANWSKLGENVGVGGDVPTLFQAFVDSPSHYENLVDSAYAYVGVGVVVSADGSRMFTAHRFMGLMLEAPAAEAPQPEPPTTTAPPPPPPPTTAVPTTTTTVPPTTLPPEPPHKFGNMDRIAELISAPKD